MLGQNIGRVGLPDMASGGRPSLSFNFAAMPKLDERITFTRASTATFFNSAGVLTSASNDVPRFDYNPSTLAAQGLLIEESRTNSIRNNTMVGAAAGTPGALPTNWSVFTSLTGLTREVVGTGSENGIAYLDIRLSGTPSAAGSYNIFQEATIATVAAVSGQTWAFTQYSKLTSGSTSGITSIQNVIIEYSAASAFLTQGATSFTPTSASLATQRYGHTRTLTNASTAFIRSAIQLNLDGVAIDITLRIGLPQLEQGAFATSVIPTTTTALTRSADVASVNTLSPWFNASASTVYFEGTVATVSDSQNPYFWSISDNTKAFGAREQIAYTRNASSAQTVGLVAAGGATNASVASSNTAVAANTVFKAAASYAANDVKVCVNGLTPATTASATLPTGLNTLKLGAPGWSGASVANAFYMRRLTYYPRSFSGVELQTLTA